MNTETCSSFQINILKYIRQSPNNFHKYKIRYRFQDMLRFSWCFNCYMGAESSAYFLFECPLFNNEISTIFLTVWIIWAIWTILIIKYLNLLFQIWSKMLSFLDLINTLIFENALFSDKTNIIVICETMPASYQQKDSMDLFFFNFHFPD